MNDILTRLQNGETIDTIAAEFTKALNEANAAYEAEKAAAEKAKAKAKDSRKAELIRNMIAPFVLYLEEFHPDFHIDGIDLEAFANPTDEECADIAELIDSYVELLNSPFLKMFGSAAMPATFKAKTTSTPNHKVEKTPTGVKITGSKPLTTEELDSIFANFFKTQKI